MGKHLFECQQRPWNCNESVMSIDLINGLFTESLQLSIDEYAIENYRTNFELEIELQIPVEYFNDNPDDGPEIFSGEEYKQVRIIFQRRIMF